MAKTQGYSRGYFRVRRQLGGGPLGTVEIRVRAKAAAQVALRANTSVESRNQLWRKAEASEFRLTSIASRLASRGKAESARRYWRQAAGAKAFRNEIERVNGRPYWVAR